MSAALLSLIVEQGADFKRVLTIKDSAGVVVNLTGYSFAGQIRRHYGDTKKLADFAFNILDQGISGNVGKVEMAISNANTSLIPATLNPDGTLMDYVYDVEMTNASSFKDRIIRGPIVFIPEVTR